MKTARWKVILVVVTNPFARRQLAATKAAAIARKCGAKVVFFNAFMVPQPVSDVPMDSRKLILQSAIREREERLAEIAAELRLPRSTECFVRWDYPIHEAIIREVLRTKPDLLIAESHRHGRLARMVLANTDWQLIRDCPCPLWFVRSPELPRDARWLVAVDPRHTHAKPAALDDRLVHAAQMAVAQLGGTVSIVHAYEPHLSAGPAMLIEPIRLPIPSERGRKMVAATMQSVLSLARKHGIQPSNCSIHEGSATDVIAAEAHRLRANVLVLGAVSRSLLARPVIGATAERVIDHVSTDVFVVKPRGFKAPAGRALPRLPQRPTSRRRGAARTSEAHVA